MEGNERKEFDKEWEGNEKENPEMEMRKDDESGNDEEQKEIKKNENEQKSKPVQRPVMVVRPVRILTREIPATETLQEETNPEPGEEEDEEEFL